MELLSREQAILKFEFVDALEAARELTGCRVYFDPGNQPKHSEEGEDLEKLIGYKASDRELGARGHIADYLPHPMNPLFVIQSGNKELMIPAVKDFIEFINPGEQSVQFILPKGISSL